jgi:hypothetical protein
VPRPHWHLEVRIIKAVPMSFEGFDTSRFEVGRVYDVNAPLCDLLVTSGYAVESKALPTPAPEPPPPTAKRAQANERSRRSPKKQKRNR